MKFKVDENLPIEVATQLQEAGYDALTVLDQALSGEFDPTIAAICQQEERVLLTLDLDFADIRSYPPAQYPGIIVFRLVQQDKPHVLTVLNRLIPLLIDAEVVHRLWIVEEERIRIRE
jgi:predicted nuclease of predicted toxin-antitoxin system